MIKRINKLMINWINSLIIILINKLMIKWINELMNKWWRDGTILAAKYKDSEVFRLVSRSRRFF